MTDTDNLALARKAWGWLSTERDWTTGVAGAEQQVYFDLLDEEVVLDVDSPSDDEIFGGAIRGRQAVMNMYTQAPEWIEDNRLERPLEFVGDGNRVVVLGAERYVIKATGVAARNKEFAIVLDFADNKIVHVRQIGDMSEWIDAYRRRNILLARQAYGDLEANREEERQTGDFQPYIDLLADDVVFAYAAPAGTPVSEPLHGKWAVVEFMTTTSGQIVEDISLDRPLEFYGDGDGDRVIILGAESYTLKKTGKRANGKEFAVVMDFRDGKIAKVLQIKDLTDFALAYRTN